MREMRFVCVQCGHKFVAKVLEPGEAEQRNMRPRSVRCPKCGGKVETD